MLVTVVCCITVFMNTSKCRNSSRIAQCPSYCFSRNPIKSFFQIHKAKIELLSFSSNFLHKSDIHWVPIFPVACIISTTSPDKPGALCLFIFFNAAATSLTLRQSAGPSLTPADILFILQLLHVLLPWIFNPFLVYNHFTRYSFQTLWPNYIVSFFYHLLCHSKNFILMVRIIKSLAHSFCFFPFVKEITLCISFTLLVLLPCLCRCFFFFNSHTFFSFPLKLQQLPHSTTMFPYAYMDLLSIHMWPVLCPSLYFSYVASVYLHQGISTLLPLLYLWPCFGILHVFSSLSFHTCTLGSNFLCYLFVVLNCIIHY